MLQQGPGSPVPLPASCLSGAKRKAPDAGNGSSCVQYQNSALVENLNTPTARPIQKHI